MKLDVKVKALLPEQTEKGLRFGYHKGKSWKSKLLSKVVNGNQIKADFKRIDPHKASMVLVHNSLYWIENRVFRGWYAAHD